MLDSSGLYTVKEARAAARNSGHHGYLCLLAGLTQQRDLVGEEGSCMAPGPRLDRRLFIFQSVEESIVYERVRSAWQGY